MSEEYVPGLVSVTLPAYANLQQSPERLASGFLDTLEVVLSLVLPVAAFLVSASPEIVAALLGAEWQGATLSICILGLAGMLKCLHGVTAALVVAMGRPRVAFLAVLGRLLMVALVVYPLTRRLALAGASLSVGLSTCTVGPVFAVAIASTGVRWRDIAQRAAVPLGLALLVPVCVHVARAALQTTPLVRLLLETALVAAVCLAGSWTASRAWRRGPLAQARRCWAALH